MKPFPFSSHTFTLSILFLGIFMWNACSVKSKHVEIKPVPFTQVHVNDAFWAPKIKTNYEVTIPIAIDQCYSSGRVDNFKIAGGLMDGDYQTEYPFDDTDIYKLIEAASYSLQNIPDPYLEARLDTLIQYIALAQEPDGYLFTSRTIDPENPHPWADTTRWTAAAKGMAGSHELYNCGHLYEAAVAHYAATGNSTLLNIATKNADLLVQDFGPGKLEFGPGHQIVEMALVRLYHATGKKEYLNLAKYFLDVRGPGGEAYSQAHEKVVHQKEPVGHAVRATYMYSAMADIASLYSDTTYKNALRTIWDDLVNKKTYVTGGIGSGGGNEGFDAAYDLPNMSAYCETCASAGNIFWNKRMFLLEGDARYYDVLEKTLYNAFLSGVSHSGDRFFYPNVLESMGQHKRSAWFGCACCPPNVARLLPSLPGYIYAQQGTDVFVNLFMSNTAVLPLGKDSLRIQQETAYPWDGRVKMYISPQKAEKFALKIRIPAWARGSVLPGGLYHFSDSLAPEFKLTINDAPATYHMNNGYAVLQRKWTKGDVVELHLPMLPRVVEANDKVKADRNKFAVQQGPIVYAAEWPDARDGKVLNLIFSKYQPLQSRFDSTFYGGASRIQASARAAVATKDGGISFQSEQRLWLTPYYLWNNRGPGEMMVWLPYTESSIRPLPFPSIAGTSRISWQVTPSAPQSINDQLMPTSANDHQFPFSHWWPLSDTTVWVECNFGKSLQVSQTKVYWFDDGPFGGCRIPEKWEVRYKKGNTWVPVKNLNAYQVTKDAWNEMQFTPVNTSALRLYVQLPEKFSAGIHEWVVEE